MFAMEPYFFDEEYSVLLVGTMTSPGKVTLSGHDRAKAWDVQPAKGTTGASTKLNGDPVGEFSATFELANEPDAETGLTEIDRWEDFQRMLSSLVANGKPRAVQVYHPDLARNEFTEVTVKKIYGLTHVGNGMMVARVDFLEYRPPKPQPTKGATAKPGVRMGPTPIEKPDPNAMRKAELAALLAQAKAP